MRCTSFFLLTFLAGTTLHAQTPPDTAPPDTAPPDTGTTDPGTTEEPGQEQPTPAEPAPEILSAPVHVPPPPSAAESDVMDMMVSPAPMPRPHDVAERFVIGFDGYLRLELTCIQPDTMCGVPFGEDDEARIAPFVGRNDGFVLGGARLNMRASYGPYLYVRLGFDGALVNYDGVTDPVGELSTGLRDAYVRYIFDRRLSLFAGRFKPPYDIESLTAERDQFFVHRALESRGVLRHEGFVGDLRGMAPGRQLGVMIGSAQLVESGAGNLGYALAVTNGNAGEESLNDNDIPAVYGRLFFSWHDAQDGVVPDDEEGPATYVQREGGLVGVSGFYNETTVGTAPSRFRDRNYGAGLDLGLNYSVFIFRGQALFTQTDHLLRGGSEPQRALGGHAQLSVHVLDTGFYPGYRFAYYDPRWNIDEDIGPSGFARVMHHTLGVRYAAERLPIVGWLEYTHSTEAAGRAIPNDRVEAAFQVDFE